MGYYTTAEIVKIVNKLIDRCGTRDPYKVAKELGINIIYRDFEKQRGAYKVILKNRFVFLKNGMHPVVEQTVKSRMRSDGLIFISFYYIRIVLCKGYLSTIFHDSVCNYHPFVRYSFLILNTENLLLYNQTLWCQQYV